MLYLLRPDYSEPRRKRTEEVIRLTKLITSLRLIFFDIINFIILNNCSNAIYFTQLKKMRRKVMTVHSLPFAEMVPSPGIL